MTYITCLRQGFGRLNRMIFYCTGSRFDYCSLYRYQSYSLQMRVPRVVVEMIVEKHSDIEEGWGDD
jgi:hypothetical protein